MKKVILPALALMCAAQLSAFTEETEVMTVQLLNGTTAEYNVDDINTVNFSVKTTTLALSIATPDADPLKLTAIPTVLRCAGTEGMPYGFGFGLVDGTTAEEMRAGQYAIEMSVPAALMNTGELQLTGNDASGAVVMLYSYNEEGKVEKVWDKLTDGTVSTALNTKTKAVTLEVNATFEDGTVVRCSYVGSVKDVESLEPLNPVPTYDDMMRYFNQDGNLSVLANITGVTTKTSSGKTRYTFAFDNSSAKSCYIEIDPTYIGQEINFATLETQNVFNFTYGSIQVSGPNSEYRNIGKEGVISVVNNEDGTTTIFADVTNKYETNYGWGTPSVGGTPERVIIKWTGTIE